MTNRISLQTLALSTTLVCAMPFLGGAQGDGCSSNSRSPAPDTTGEWDITYDDNLDVVIKLGGAVYDATLPAGGGEFIINHQGRALSFDLDCARPEVVCPSEGWPGTVTVEQRNEKFEHRMIVTLPTQECMGSLRAPESSECGTGTENPECDDICDGAVTVRNQERFGVIGEAGNSFRLFLGAGIATNGINCALLAASVADATLVTEGTANDGDWYATEMASGLVTVGYSGGCLWAGDPDQDNELEALLIGASITFRTGFTGARL